MAKKFRTRVGAMPFMVDAKAHYQETTGHAVLTVQEFHEQYHPTVTSQAIYNAIDYGMVTSLRLENTKCVVIDEHTLSYVPTKDIRRARKAAMEKLQEQLAHQAATDAPATPTTPTTPVTPKRKKEKSLIHNT